jgi:tetratricopeptide (TPR) repeat protein
VSDWDLGWQMATGRWIVQHRQIPSTDVLSYTAQGKPWKYPVASGLIFYVVYLAGGYALLSILGAAACVSTVALLLRRGSWLTAALAILAIPRIALRTTPRAEIFTVVLFAAFLTLLWEQYETGRARLWLLPVMMVAWVNLHLGLTAGLALVAGYVLLESLAMVWPNHHWPNQRQSAIDHLRRAWPWFLATLGAMLVNPWGWRVFATSLHLMTPMTARSQQILEWAPTKLNWTTFIFGLSLRSPDTFAVLLLVVATAVPVALIRRQLGAAVWLCGAALLGVRSQRLQVLFSIVVVIVAGSVLTSALASLQRKIEDARLFSILTVGACCFIVLLVCVWSGDLVTNRTYMGTTALASFGTGLGWWFPEGGAAFIERAKIPGRIFNTYDEGGYITWRLGPNYRDYVDGRGDPFGPELLQHSMELTGMSPDSPDWERESEQYGINAIIVSLARYWGVEEFPLLRQFCTSNNWRPVYLDETSAVFVRYTPANENLIAGLQINCDTAPIPAVAPTSHDIRAFNQWANAAAVLKALGREPQALAATSKALAIFPDSAFLRLTRADLLEDLADLRGAEQEYLVSASLLPNPVSWTRLAKLYDREHRVREAIAAWKHDTEVAPDTASLPLLSLGFDYLDASQPQEALDAFHRSVASFQKENGYGIEHHKPYYANLAHGQAVAYEALRDIKRAISCEEEAVRLTPDRQEDWLKLGKLYEMDGRPGDAERARKQAAALSAPEPSIQQ